MERRIIRLKDLVGPYNYSPLFISFIILILNLPRLRTYSYDYPFGAERVRYLLSGFVISALMAFLLYFSLKILQFYWKSRSKNLVNYLFEVLIAVVISLLIQIAAQHYLVSRVHLANFLRTGEIFPELASRFFCAILLVAVTNHRQRILESNLESSRKINDELAQRYELLIASDEEIRTQAAQLLHDRIQSKMMLTGAKLTKIADGLSSDIKEGIVLLVKDLEDIRTIEVREVSHLLTPNLEGEGLIGSCENLCHHFESEIHFKIAIDPQLENLSSEYKLGIYRIIEQAVVNAIKHGPASHIAITASNNESGDLTVEVSDNGPGSKISNPGKGTVIIDSWVSKLGARKELESPLAGGYTLRIFIPELQSSAE